MENLFFCVHGHFYQPPREDPLTGQIPVEPGAAPYMNWNERIYAQCYEPNARLRNFEKISFNIGPTLCDWLAKEHPDTLASIVAQDRANLQRYGVGNAMAQSYNHTILPLASRQDKITQVLWGIADFKFRFGHDPLGMWLPETAADDETLLTLAECGIQYTILAPWQADTLELDPLQPYRIPLPGGKEIAAFFYQQDLSARISFDPGATIDADRFALQAILPKYRLHKGRALEPQIVLIASDGELYGHHQPFRDKFLAYLMDGALKPFQVNVTFPALYLRQYPLKKRVLIRENTSWSCHHGVARWKGACGCCPDGEWKGHLRAALNGLADAIDAEYARFLERYRVDPWQVRNEFIHVILGEQTLEEFAAEWISPKLEAEETRQIGHLLWAQYERQRMFTSCGWFFDDFDRIEPRNNVAYAAQAVWLMEKATGVQLAGLATQALDLVVSRRSGLRASEVFRNHLRRASQYWQMKRESRSL